MSGKWASIAFGSGRVLSSGSKVWGLVQAGTVSLAVFE